MEELLQSSSCDPRHQCHYKGFSMLVVLKHSSLYLKEYFVIVKEVTFCLINVIVFSQLTTPVTGNGVAAAAVNGRCNTDFMTVIFIEASTLACLICFFMSLDQDNCSYCFH